MPDDTPRDITELTASADFQELLTATDLATHVALPAGGD